MANLSAPSSIISGGFDSLGKWIIPLIIIFLLIIIFYWIKTINKKLSENKTIVIRASSKSAFSRNK